MTWFIIVWTLLYVGLVTIIYYFSGDTDFRQEVAKNYNLNTEEEVDTQITSSYKYWFFIYVLVLVLVMVLV